MFHEIDFINSRMQGFQALFSGLYLKGSGVGRRGGHVLRGSLGRVLQKKLLQEKAAEHKDSWLYFQVCVQGKTQFSRALQ